MKQSHQYILKLILLVIITLFALFNYRFISFDKGISKTSMDDMSVSQVLATVTNITKIEYYQRPFKKEEPNDKEPRPLNVPYYNYRVYIITNNDAYLLKATNKDIEALQTLGIVNQSLKPNKIKPIPYYVEIIIGFLVLVIPFGIPKNKSKEKD